MKFSKSSLDRYITGNYGEDEFSHKSGKHQIEYGNFILCSDLKWRHKGFNDGGIFDTETVDHLFDKWNQERSSIDINKIEIIDVI